MNVLIAEMLIRIIELITNCDGFFFSDAKSAKKGDTLRALAVCFEAEYKSGKISKVMHDKTPVKGGLAPPCLHKSGLHSFGYKTQPKNSKTEAVSVYDIPKAPIL